MNNKRTVNTIKFGVSIIFVTLIFIAVFAIGDFMHATTVENTGDGILRSTMKWSGTGILKVLFQTPDIFEIDPEFAAAGLFIFLIVLFSGMLFLTTCVSLALTQLGRASVMTAVKVLGIIRIAFLTLIFLLVMSLMMNFGLFLADNTNTTVTPHAGFYTVLASAALCLATATDERRKSAAKKFGENFKRLRTARGLSVKAAAEILGVSRFEVLKWESASDEPDLATLGRIADYFSVSVDSLLNGGDLAGNDSADTAGVSPPDIGV